MFRAMIVGSFGAFALALAQATKTNSTAPTATANRRIIPPSPLYSARPLL